MANCLPFNSISKDRVYKAEDWAWYFSTFIGNGIFPSPSTGLQAVVNSGMTVTVKAGYAFVNGYAFRNPANYDVTLETADGSLPRIDRIIVRWDLSARNMYVGILKGTASASPAAPAVTRSTEVYDLAVADIYVAKGVTSILTANITDQRFNSSVCGIVTGTVDQIDASVLTAQFNNFFLLYKQQIITEYQNYLGTIAADQQAATTALAAFEAGLSTYETEQKVAFEAWVASIKDILDESTAGNIQNEIESLQSTVTNLQQELIERTSITTEAWLGACYCGGTYLVS
jgi:hypothetical protein